MFAERMCYVRRFVLSCQPLLAEWVRARRGLSLLANDGYRRGASVTRVHGKMKVSTRKRNSETLMPTVFVLMPFDEEFAPVYDRFIKPLFEKAGFTVERADDILSQQNILKVILQGIHKCDLVIADLTKVNPNVFYELGLAHALKKPVILITQSRDEVPFDLKSYRLLEYSRDFVKIQEASEELLKYAEGFLNGTMSFGSPVTDFLPDAPSQSKIIEQFSYNDPKEDERGFLDHLFDLVNGYNGIARIAEGTTEGLHILTGAIGDSSRQFEQIGANRTASSPAAARRIARKLAEQVALFKTRLKKANGEYSGIARNTEDSLEIVLGFQQLQPEASSQETVEHLNSLRRLHDNVKVGRDGLLDMAASMDDVPRIERRLNRELKEGIEEILEMAGNLDKTIASISRALEKYG